MPHYHQGLRHSFGRIPLIDRRTTVESLIIIMGFSENCWYLGTKFSDQEYYLFEKILKKISHVRILFKKSKKLTAPSYP